MTQHPRARYCIGDCPPWDPLARFERDDGQLEYCYMGSGWMQGGVCFFSRAIAEPLPGFIDTVPIEPDQRNRCVSWWTRVCWDREECGGCGDKCEDFETPVFQDCCPAADATRNDCDYLVWPYRRCAPWDDPPHRHTAVATMAFMQVFYPVDGEVTFEKLEDAELKLGVWGVVGDTGSYTGRRYGRTNRCSRWAGDEFDVAGQWDYNSGPHLLDLAYDLSIPGYRIERIYEGLTKTAIDLISGLSNCSDPCFHCFGENWNFEHTWELPEVSVNFQLRAP